MLPPVLLLSLLLLPGLSANSTAEARTEAGPLGATGEVTAYISKSPFSRSSDSATYPIASTAEAATTKTEAATPPTSLPPAGTAGETSSSTVQPFSAPSINPTTGTVRSSISTSRSLDVTTSKLITTSREHSNTTADITSVALNTSAASVTPALSTSLMPASTHKDSEGSGPSSVATSTTHVTSASSTVGNAHSFSTNTSGTVSTATDNTTTKTPVPVVTDAAEKASPGARTSLAATKTVSTKSRTDSQGTVLNEASKGLSSGAIAAITIVVIAFVLLVFGSAAYLKIRHSSYGRLLDDHDYGSWGNYNNPLYDDS